MKMKLLVFLLFFALTIFSCLHHCFARGGSQTSVLSGDLNRISRASHARHLFQDFVSDTRLSELAEGYMTNDELETAINDFGVRCSNISRIYSIGKSVNGVRLWVIEISKKPGEEDGKPAFKYIGNVHGDEPVGRELLMFLANWLCDNHLKDPLATLIVENVHLHLLPSLNPDGFELRRRNNANNIDLNRDFPDQFFPINEDENARQPETRAIMNWLRDIQFTASATLHGGALVANYPWDGTKDKRTTYYACPDDDTFQFIARIYSHSHYNMSFSKEFTEGITNGASWYPIYGGMQDWNYIHAGCFELTLEVSDNKWPSAAELPTIWKYNKMSMLNLVASLVKEPIERDAYINHWLTGVHGRIFSATDGRPLPGSIMVRGINYKVSAGKTVADYHRLLAPRDRYEVIAIMPGYKSKSATISLDEGPVTLNFVLDPEDTIKGIEFAGIFWGAHLEIYVVLMVIIGILCLIFNRRMKVNVLKPRQSGGAKRPAMV